MMEPTWREVIRYAEEGECWICGRTGFKKLSQHLAMRHDLHADEVRERYGLCWRQSLVSPEYSDELRARSRELALASYLPRRAPVQPQRTRMTDQARASAAEVANRTEVKRKFLARQAEPDFQARRAHGLQTSELAAKQREEARRKRWPQGSSST